MVLISGQTVGVSTMAGVKLVRTGLDTGKRTRSSYPHGSFRDFVFLFWHQKENDDDDFWSSLLLIVLT